MTRRRAAAGLTVLIGLLVWNAIFDREIRAAASSYVSRQSRYARGLAPYVSMDSVMRPAVTRGAERASVWAGASMLAAYAVFRLTDAMAPRRQRR